MAGDCILCGKCLEVCPLINATNREELAPRAKAELSRLLESGEYKLKGKDVAKLAGLCLGCHRCKKVCSQGVDAPGLVAGLRKAHPDFKRWVWKTWLTNAKELWSTGSSAAQMVPEQFVPEKFSQQLKMLAGLKGGPGLESFLELDSFPDTHRGEKVLLFAGCTANFVQGRWLMTALRLLEGLGVDVLPGDFTCCGSSLKSVGCDDEAGSMAAANVGVWREADKPKVVTFCASCLAGLEGYERVFRNKGEAEEWKDSLLPLSSLLTDVTATLSDGAPEAIGYHRPCHVDDLDADFLFLQSALGERLSAATQKECCGFGGVMRLGTPELADAVNRQCWERLEGSDVVVTGCSACATQLASTAKDSVQVGHWLEVLL